MKLSQIVILVPLNSSGFKGVRFLDPLYALELGASPFAIGAPFGRSPVFRVSSVFLAVGSDSSRSGRVV